MCDAVIFDMDGTLLDSIEDIADAMNLALGRFGYPVHPVERYRTFVGDGMEALAMRALPEDRRSPGNVAVCTEALKEEYSAR
ncbi:MAG TPA: HAD hydrolase-like protein, partial [Deltaproteobacteria bacterium]|nr:HAD hydrolase-like protein [Deltaproteobacteria bacterium]